MLFGQFRHPATPGSGPVAGLEEEVRRDRTGDVARYVTLKPSADVKCCSTHGNTTGKSVQKKSSIWLKRGRLPIFPQAFLNETHQGT